MKAESWELVRLFAGVLAVGAAVILAGSIQVQADATTSRSYSVARTTDARFAGPAVSPWPVRQAGDC